MGREVQKYQSIIVSVFQKMEIFVETYAEYLGMERANKLKQIILALRQTRQSTNIDKLRIIGELALLKVGELEVEIANQNREIRKSQFLKETNSLLRDLGSSKRVGSEVDYLRKKVKHFFSQIKTSVVGNSEDSENNIDTTGFLYFKNLRELSIYREKLKEINREIWRNIFGDPKKKERLFLKKKLLEQNILIIESRVENKTISYSKITKGLGYYEDIFFYMIRSVADGILYILLLSIV